MTCGGGLPRNRRAVPALFFRGGSPCPDGVAGSGVPAAAGRRNAECTLSKPEGRGEEAEDTKDARWGDRCREDAAKLPPR